MIATSSVAAPFRCFAERFGAQSPEEAVTLACAKLLHDSGELVPPIGLRALARHLNARIIERLIPTAGRLQVDRSGYVIVTKSGSPWRRERFTLAHEIGHIIILESLAHDRSLLRELRADHNWAYLERLCNLAAAEILIPSGDFAAFVSQLNANVEPIRKLYDRYLCSLPPLYIRFATVFPGTSITVWRKHARHVGEPVAWRVTQCFSSTNGPWMPEGMTTKHIMPNVVRSATLSGADGSANVVLELSSRKRNLCAAAFLHKGRTSGDKSLPIFSGIEVQDEPVPSEAVVMLAWPCSLRGSVCKPLAGLLVAADSTYQSLMVGNS